MLAAVRLVLGIAVFLSLSIAALSSRASAEEVLPTKAVLTLAAARARRRGRSNG